MAQDLLTQAAAAAREGDLEALGELLSSSPPAGSQRRGLPKDARCSILPAALRRETSPYL